MAVNIIKTLVFYQLVNSPRPSLLFLVSPLGPSLQPRPCYNPASERLEPTMRTPPWPSPKSEPESTLLASDHTKTEVKYFEHNPRIYTCWFNNSGYPRSLTKNKILVMIRVSGFFFYYQWKQVITEKQQQQPASSGTPFSKRTFYRVQQWNPQKPILGL